MCLYHSKIQGAKSEALFSVFNFQLDSYIILTTEELARIALLNDSFASIEQVDPNLIGSTLRLI